MSGETVATLLIIGSAFLHAVWNAAVRKSADKFIAISFITTYGGLLYVPFAFVVPFPPLEIWGWIALSTAVHLIYQISLAAAMEHGPLTTVYPIARGTGPLVVTLVSYFILQEDISFEAFLAITILVGGIFISARQRQLHVPPKAILYAFITGLMISAYTLADGIAVRLSENSYSFIVWSGIAAAPLIFITGIKRRGWVFVRSSITFWKAGIPCALMAHGGYAMALMAFTLAPLGKIAALRETSIVFATLIGVLYLGEHFNRIKLLSILMISAGALLIKAF